MKEINELRFLLRINSCTPPPFLCLSRKLACGSVRELACVRSWVLSLALEEKVSADRKTRERFSPNHVIGVIYAR